MNSLHVGFVGIGSMGWPMAAQLASADLKLTVADSDPSRRRSFAQEHGVRQASEGADWACDCNVLVTMLPSSSIVDEVIFGKAGLAAALRPGTLVVEMSSGVPVQTIDLARRLAERGIRLVDAPVSGGVARAKTGELAIMVGGTDEDAEVARPLLAFMGSAILRTGPVGSAHAMKALNNLVSAAGYVAGIEALLIGQKFGLDPALMVDVLNASTGVNNSTQKKFKQHVLSGAYASGFGLDLMLKDIGIAVDLARRTGTASPLTSACHDVWQAAQNVLGPGRDHTEVARWSELQAGTNFEVKQINT